jgi:hypothetical protein
MTEIKAELKRGVDVTVDVSLEDVIRGMLEDGATPAEIAILIVKSAGKDVVVEIASHITFGMY